MEPKQKQYQIGAAVQTIKQAILQSLLRAVRAVNQEQLALYFGIGRYVSENTRKGFWGKGAIAAISEQLRKELPGLRGFSKSSIKNMRMFFEEWRSLENSNSPVPTGEITNINTLSAIPTGEITDINRIDEIRQLRLANLPDNFAKNIPDTLQAYRAIQMFKDDYLLDFINTEELFVRDKDSDERVIEQAIVHNVKEFIMTFGKDFTFVGNQYHLENWKNFYNSLLILI